MPKCHRCAWHEHLKDFCELEPSYPDGCDAFRPKKPTIGQSILCVVGILSLQALMTWLDNVPLNDLYIALGMLVILLNAWVIYQIIRGRKRR